MAYKSALNNCRIKTRTQIYLINNNNNNNISAYYVPDTVQIALCIILSHHSNPMWQCTRYYYPILQKRKLRPTRDKGISQRPTLGQSQSSDPKPVLPDSKAWAFPTELLPTWLLTSSFLDCFTARSLLIFLTKLLLLQVQGHCYLFLLNMHGHRTGPWVDAQKIFAECMTALK